MMNPFQDFQDLGLCPEILQSIESSGFLTPTTIQRISIPEIFKGEDLLVEAQTGSGKTACFAWPLLQALQISQSNESKGIAKIKVLVLTPTRELAYQVSGAFYRFGEFFETKKTVLTVIGGESIAQQSQSLQNGVDVVVATPGRLLDLLEKKVLDLSEIEFLVLDEADKILDLGFAAELEILLGQISPKRQNLFFSATYPEKVLEIVKKISSSARILKIENATPSVEAIEQRVIQVNRENRGMLLRHMIKESGWKNALIFVGSKVAAHNLTEKLKKVGINVETIHGDLSQSQRNTALSQFKERKCDFLVATDVTARGIDFKKLSMVINFDLPRSPADYIHRIGRTARAGETGVAVSFIGLEDLAHFQLIEKRAEINLFREEIAGFELNGDIPLIKLGAPPVKGKRKSKKDKLRELTKTQN